MKKRSLVGVLGSFVLGACLAVPGVVHAQSGAGSSIIGELDAVGNVRVAQRDEPSRQMNVSDTRYAFFNGDGLATAAGARATLDLENESRFMFLERTGSWVGVFEQRVLSNLDSGTVCFGIPRTNVELQLMGGPYVFSGSGAAAGVVSLVDGRVEAHVHEGTLLVREAEPAANQQPFEAVLAAGESIGLSVANAGSVVAVETPVDPCTPRGFGWLGPGVLVAPAVLATGGAATVLGAGAVLGVAAGGAVLQDNRRPDPVSP